MSYAYRQDLNWLVSDFTGRVPDVAHAAVVSADGVPLSIEFSGTSRFEYVAGTLIVAESAESAETALALAREPPAVESTVTRARYHPGTSALKDACFPRPEITARLLSGRPISVHRIVASRKRPLTTIEDPASSRTSRPT